MRALLKNTVLPILVGVTVWALLPAAPGSGHRVVWVVLSALAAAAIARAVDRPKKTKARSPAQTQRTDLSGSTTVVGDITAGDKIEIVSGDKVLQQVITIASTAVPSSVWESPDYHAHLRFEH